MVRESQSSLIVTVVLGIVAVIIVGLTASVAASAVMLPGCASCHLKGDFATATASSAHAAIPCASCHVPADALSRAGYGVHVVSRTLIPFKQSVGRSASGVPDSACLACHAVVKQEVVSANGLRIDHAKCAVGSRCTDCHSSTAHGAAAGWTRTYNMDTCLHCHAQGDTVVRCDTCHEERRTKDRIVVGPWRVTHGPNWRKTHGMGDQFTCLACHPQGYCTKCHGPGLPHGVTFMNDHSTIAKSPGAKCNTCHGAAFCTGCHGIQMPHPSGFTARHSALVKKNGRTVCRTCHSARDCIQCHVMHVHPGGAVGASQTPPAGGVN